MSTVTDPELLRRLNAKLQAQQLGDEAQVNQDRLAKVAATKEQWEGMSAFDQFATGAGKPGWQMYYGAKDMLTDLSPEDKEHLMHLEQAKGGWAAGGEMLTDAAAMAVPGKAITTAVSGVAKALPRALAGIGLESGVVGSYEGLKAPEAGETRLGNAGTAAAVTGALGAVAPTIGGIAGQVTPKAKQMIDAGIPLTPGMARPRLGGLERQMSAMPVIGKPVGRMQDKAIEQWNRNLLQEVAPPGRRGAITTHGREGFKQLREQYTAAYKNIWKGVKTKDLNLHDLSKGWQGVVNNLQGLSKETLGPVENALNRSGALLSDFAKTGDTGYLSKADDLLREIGEQVDDVTVPHILAMREVMFKALPKKVGNKLRATDASWARYKTAERGQGYVKSMETNRINPRQLQTSIGARSEGGQLARGEGLLQKRMDDANMTLNNVLPERSAINPQGAIYNAATAGAAVMNPALTIGGLTAGRGLTTEPVRRMMTGGMTTKEEELVRLLRMNAGIWSND